MCTRSPIPTLEMKWKEYAISVELEKAHKCETNIQNGLKERSCDISKPQTIYVITTKKFRVCDEMFT